MDNWENIKEALKLTGGKYVLAEKGEPSYVIVELDEYVDLLKRNDKKEIDFMRQRIKYYRGIKKWDTLH